MKRLLSPEEKRERRAALFMTALCSLLYFTSYIARKSFSAVKLGMTDVFTDVEMGTVASALFFAYGAGQIVSGILADKFRPQRLIYVGLVLTAACNISAAFISFVPLLIAVWALNGFAQALFWPPILKILVTRVAKAYYANSCAIITVAASVATVAVYFLAAGAISLGNYRLMFYIATGLSLLVLFLLSVLFPAFDRRYYRKTKTENNRQSEKVFAVSVEKKTGFFRFFIVSGLLFICLSMVINGFVRDGIDEWLPTYFKTAFSLGSDSATLIAVITPLFAILFIELANILYQTVFRKNELWECGAFFLLSLVASFLLIFFCETNILLSLVLLALVNGSVHSINFCLTTLAPRRFEASGHLSTVAGVVNASVYVGSTFASTVVSVVFTASGWSATFLMFALLSMLGVLLSAILIFLLRSKKPIKM